MSTPAPLDRFAPEPALLVLEDGEVFAGSAWGARGTTLGEVVFTTGMTGYQETLTDPSFAGQIVALTAPHVGNTGWNDEDDESRRIFVEGIVVRDPALRPSNWRSQRTLEDELVSQDVVGIAGIDTRALTRHLRTRGAMRAGVFSGEDARASHAELVEQVRSAPGMAGRELATTVTTPQTVVVPPQGEHRFTVAAVDLGIKSNTPRLLAARGIEVHVLPAESTLEDVLAVQGVARGAGEGPDGVFFSNGPGDPATADTAVELLRGVLAQGLPFFGICFGNQLLGRALGFGTYKLDFGHRGINQPVMDRTTGKVEITAQNHGFAVDAPLDAVVTAPHDEALGRVWVSHVCLNDDVVEGLECLDLPAFSVQYHPEAAAGPHDSEYLFDRFTELMTTGRAPDRSEQLARAGAQPAAGQDTAGQTAPTAGDDR
ncbi:glutamine-hydrolyzing carbamoyl-phosphate synthase small subunit [Kytococcus sedentarius]|uniref:glutamine-hydrolyzing carbamoyl-phosphate synthase small subunit n=1 Tax=Kytococcus sedentarius TaxID=1276 RepID=UPI0035BC189B